MGLPENKNRILTIVIVLFVVQCILFFTIEWQIHALNKKIFNNNKLIVEKLINNQPSELKTELDPNDIILGDNNAPVTLAMFSNYNCSVCKSFFLENFTELENQYIKTGKVRFVLKFIVPKKPVQADYITKSALFAYKNKKFELFNSFVNQSEVLPDSAQINDFVIKELKLDQKSYDQYISDPEIENYLDNNQKFFRKHRLKGTPAFLINDSLFFGNKTYSKFEEIINIELNK